MTVHRQEHCRQVKVWSTLHEPQDEDITPFCLHRCSEWNWPKELEINSIRKLNLTHL